MPEETLRMNLVAQDRMSRTVKGVSGSFGSLQSKILAAASAYIGFRAAQRTVRSAVQATTRAMKEGVDQAADYEQAAIRLAQAMKSSNNFSYEAYDAALDNARALQRLTNFTENQILAAEAMLATFKLNADTMKTATELTLNMAAATGADLVQAAVLMGKAAVGVTGTLSRYGIIVDQADLKTRGFQAVVEEINKEFGGQARAVMLSYAGALGQVGSAYGDILKETGRFITESPGMRALLQSISAELYVAADATAELRMRQRDLVTGITTDLVNAMLDLLSVGVEIEAYMRGIASDLPLWAKAWLGLYEVELEALKIFREMPQRLKFYTEMLGLSIMMIIKGEDATAKYVLQEIKKAQAQHLATEAERDYQKAIDDRNLAMQRALEWGLRFRESYEANLEVAEAVREADKLAREGTEALEAKIIDLRKAYESVPGALEQLVIQGKRLREETGELSREAETAIGVIEAYALKLRELRAQEEAAVGVKAAMPAFDPSLLPDFDALFQRGGERFESMAHFLAAEHQTTVEEVLAAQAEFQQRYWDLNAETYGAQYKLLDAQYQYYQKFILDQAALDDWYAQRKTALNEEVAYSSIELATSTVEAMAEAGIISGAVAKRAAQIQAMVDAYAAANAAMKSLSGIPVIGPALGFAAFAATLAKGLASVKIIQAQKYVRGGILRGPEGEDVIPFWGTSGETLVPAGPSQKYAPELGAMIREARTGVPAFREREPTRLEFIFNVNTYNAAAMAEDLQHGELHDAVEETFRRHFFEFPEEMIS